MTTLANLLNPPNDKPSKEDQYRYDNSVYESLNAISAVSNPSMITNADFSTLGSNGTTAVTQAAGNNAEFSNDWNVFGASLGATYSLQSIAYPTGAISSSSPSSVQSASNYYVHYAVTANPNNELYIYQRQANTVRKYQNTSLTFGVVIRNNNTSTIKIKLAIYSYFDTTNELLSGKTIYLEPGLNTVSSSINISKLTGKTLGAGNYTDFRLYFVDTNTANIDLHQIKCEFGTVTTPYTGV